MYFKLGVGFLGIHVVCGYVFDPLEGPNGEMQHDGYGIHPKKFVLAMVFKPCLNNGQIIYVIS
jgi:hypothetical protein